MIRVGICDDEASARDSLRLKLEKMDLFDQGEAEVIYEFNSGEGLVSWLGKHRGELDLVFLDVEMKALNGVEAARKIRESDRNILLVFLTGYADFVFSGYEVEALDYLLKPVKETDLKRVMARASDRMADETRHISLRNSDGTYRLYKEEIMYVCSQGRQVGVVLTDGRTLWFYQKLDQLEEVLGRGFVRIHQRYLVASRHVRVMGSDQVSMTNGQQLPVSRSLKQAAMAKLARNMMGE